jgi:hypothetical protein
VIPIARAAGSLKRADPDASEEVILYRTMLDLIKPKLVYLDLPLFMALLSDLFPGVELPSGDGGVLRAAIEQDLRGAGMQVQKRSRHNCYEPWLLAVMAGSAMQCPTMAPHVCNGFSTALINLFCVSAI